MSLDCLELKNIDSDCNKLIFILHGYGADAQDLISIGSFWQRFLPKTYFCAPNAPTTCQVNPGGYEWFDLLQTDHNKINKEFQIALEKLDDSINTKLKILGLTLNDLIMVGFSQGTMMSLQYALSRKSKIAGVLGYSGKIFDYDFLEKNLACKTKIKLLHGNADEIVPIEEMYKSVDFLKKKEIDIDFNVYNGCGHTITPEGISEGLNFIKSLS